MRALPRHRRLVPLAAVAVASVSLWAAPAAQAQQACQSANAGPSQASHRKLVRATLCVLNAERRQRGLRGLRLNRRLSKAGRRHARDMARRNYFSHTSLSGASFVDRIRRTGYLRSARRWSVGENLAWGAGDRSTPRSIMRAWMTSPGHRANVLRRSFREIGIGVVFDAPAGSWPEAATYATEFGVRG